jgi:glycosyltransferase involved in cell wall biosynthesis
VSGPAPPGPDPGRALAVRGPFRGVTGHDHHTREFVRHLAAQGVRITLTDIPQWHPVKLPPETRDPWFDQLEAPARTSTPSPASTTLHFCMPHQVTQDPGRLTVNYTMFEASPVPAGWAGRSDLVVVPTESSRQAWLAAGHPPDQLATCPLGVDVDRFRPGREPFPLTAPDGRPVAGYQVRVLNVSEPRPRKNLAGLLRTWITATSAGDDAILIVKLGPAPRPAQAALFAQLARLQPALGQAAPVLFTDRLLPGADMPGLYAAATHYWSMSHGEGWDQPMTEAAAAGLRLIAPRHSAYECYLDDDVARLIPSRLVPADASADPGTAALFAGTRWWSPDEDAAARAVRDALDGRDQPKASARDRMAAGFTWPHAAARLIEVLDGLHQRHGRRF